jgi:GT2 family glycosyltransferase
LYEIGGFDERFIYYLDETDMCIRLARKGYSIFNHPLNFIKHFKAPSKVRKGSAYDTQWNIVARSDMYYALKNGLDSLAIRLLKATLAFRKKHFYREIVRARKENKITAEEYKKYKKLMWQGFHEGRKWGLAAGQNQQALKEADPNFLNFHVVEHAAI